MPLNQICQLTMWNLSGTTTTLSIQQTSMPAGTVPLREESCYVAAAETYACWPCIIITTNTAAVQTCLLVECCCKRDASWTVATQSACLSIFCHSILHVCWYCGSLPYLLALCLAISRVCRCGTSLSAMPVGVVPHFGPACWSVPTATDILLVKCR